MGSSQVTVDAKVKRESCAPAYKGEGLTMGWPQVS